MIESHADEIAFEPLATEDPDSITKDPEPVSSKPQHITSSFRRTLRHLGGSHERFRGVWIFIFNALVVQWVTGFLAILPIIHFMPRGLLTVAAAVLCAQLSLGWTHIVISQSSPETWFHRLPSISEWKKVAIPTAVLALAEQLAVWIPLSIATLAGIVNNASNNLITMTPHQQTVMGLKATGIAALSLVLSFVLVIPANVTLTRVQASLLDDAEETIVPFDRSFGGKVMPEIVGGSGVAGMLDAWESFDWASRIRLVKAYVKVFAMQVAASILFAVVFVAQLFVIVGKDWSKFVPEITSNGT